MVFNDCRFVFIDFGFIFGKEPGGKEKFASKIRVSKTMIEVMGGVNSDMYAKFEKKYVESFLQIRNKMNYILGLMHLMIHAGIGDLLYDQRLRE